MAMKIERHAMWISVATTKVDDFEKSAIEI